MNEKEKKVNELLWQAFRAGASILEEEKKSPLRIGDNSNGKLERITVSVPSPNRITRQKHYRELMNDC